MTRFLALACTLALLGCSDRVSLRSQSGALELQYACTNPRSQLRTPAAAALVKRYAVLAVRNAHFQQRDTTVRAVAHAYESGDMSALEQAVVRYVCTYGDVQDAATPRFPEPGSTPPAFVLHRAGASGRVVSRDSLQGHVAFLAFWATWCPPCQDEFPELRQIYERYKDRGVDVYVVLYEDNPERARAWMRQHGGELPLLVDPGSRVAEDFHLPGVPSTYLLDRDGTLAGHYLSSGNHLEKHLLPLLATGA